MMNELKLLNLEMARKPSKEIADKTLAYLRKNSRYLRHPGS